MRTTLSTGKMLATRQLAFASALLAAMALLLCGSARALAECARVLRRAGAGKVWVATLARAQAARVAMWDDGAMTSGQGFG